jgi:homoserine kinase type II
MAVYTDISTQEVSDWLAQNFDLGPLTLFEGIRGGIENSNFFLDTKTDAGSDHYVLTIFERLNHAQLPYYLNLMLHLSEHHIQVPKPISNTSGEILQTLKGKPAVIVTKLEGQSELVPNPEHCIAVAKMLAKMHLAGQNYPLHQDNLRSLSWWQTTSLEILPFLDASKKELITSEVQAQKDFFASPVYQELPSGACHCDLFRDNVLFKQGHELSGFFDFYFAGQDKWLFDVAVTVNDWCIDLASGVLQDDRLDAFLKAYQSIRPLTHAELQSWNMMLRAAALRFWISRLWDFYLPRNAELLTPHDPTHFERILRLRVNANAN